jgi:hypothetical protein
MNNNARTSEASAGNVLTTATRKKRRLRVAANTALVCIAGIFVADHIFRIPDVAFFLGSVIASLSLVCIGVVRFAAEYSNPTQEEI